MKILITGGAGFIGSNLCDYLLEKNNKLVILDNLETGNIKNLLKSKTNKIFKVDITNMKKLKDKYFKKILYQVLIIQKNILIQMLKEL